MLLSSYGKRHPYENKQSYTYSRLEELAGRGVSLDNVIDDELGQNKMNE